MYTAHSECVSIVCFLSQFATVVMASFWLFCLFKDYGQLCALLWLLYTNQLANSLQNFRTAACTKEKPTSQWSEGKTHLLLTIMKDFLYYCFLDIAMPTFSRRWLIKGIKVWGCVWMVKQVRHWWKTSKILLCTAACKREYKWTTLFH